MRFEPEALAAMGAQEREALVASRRRPFFCWLGWHWLARGVRDPNVYLPRKMVFCRRCGALFEYSILKD